MDKAAKIILTAVISTAMVAATTQARAEANGFSKMIGSVNSSIKSGFSKVSESISPKPTKSKASDATSVWVKGKPSAKLYVTAAHTHISNDNLQDAEDMYKRALKISPEYADALTGYAQLKNQQGAYGEAAAMYEKAAKAHPEDATVFNGMGLCHATHGNFERALPALEPHVALQPREMKYRNNIAMVLVEMGRYDEAFAHFRTLYDNSVAHYNLAYLIQKRGDKPAALEHFAAALATNPDFSEAKVWYEHLAGTQTPVVQTPVVQAPVIQGPFPYKLAPQQHSQQRPRQVARDPSLVARQPDYHLGSMEPSIHHPRVWTPRQQAPPPQQQMTAQRIQIPPQRDPMARNQSAAQRESMAKEQLRALSSATAPIRTPVEPDRTTSYVPSENEPVTSDPRAMAFRPRPDGNVPANYVPENTVPDARQQSFQRLPPIEQSFESAAPPTGQKPVHQLSAPPVPLPPKPAVDLNLGWPAMPSQEQTPQPSVQLDGAAPLPGPIVPSAPPSNGTTRAPMVYPLPPVDGYWE